MRCTGCKTGAKDSYKPVLIPCFPPVYIDWLIDWDCLICKTRKMPVDWHCGSRPAAVLFVAHKTAVLLRWLAHNICQLRHATVRMLPVDECDAESDKRKCCCRWFLRRCMTTRAIHSSIPYSSTVQARQRRPAGGGACGCLALAREFFRRTDKGQKVFSWANEMQQLSSFIHYMRMKKKTRHTKNALTTSTLGRTAWAEEWEYWITSWARVYSQAIVHNHGGLWAMGLDAWSDLFKKSFFLFKYEFFSIQIWWM
jgi:hypothetical protein